MIRTIFIDLDDTLWATQENNRDSLEEVYRLRGWEAQLGPFDEFFKLYQPHNDHLWDLYRRGAVTKHELTLRRLREPLEPGLGRLTDEQVLEINADFLARTAAKEKVVPGALELLRELKQLYRIVVVSNGFREIQTRKMASSGILPYVDVTVLSEDAESNKPNKRFFTYAFSVSHTRPSEVILIGDSWDADIIGAQNVGIPSIWFNPQGEPWPELQAPKAPIYEVADLSEIVPLLTSLRVC